MSENKRYYWMKLKKDFFDQKMIKILRTFDDGEKMIMIFLKIQLHSLENDGYIYYENMLPAFEQELAVAIDEDIEKVKLTLDTLIRFGAVEKIDEKKYYITALEDCIGSESASAKRVREHREREKCNAEALHCNTEIEKDKDKEKELYQSKSKTPSSFSSEKKGGSFSGQKNYYGYGKKPLLHKGTAYDLGEVQKIISQSDEPVSFQKLRNDE